MLIGAHLSVADGYPSTIEYAQMVGAECLQIFAKSPRQWNAKPLDPAKVEEFVSRRQSEHIGPVFTHTAYLINLSTDDDMLRARSTAALADELTRGAMLGAAGVVTHVGNDPAGDPQAAARRAAAAIDEAFALAPGARSETRLLLENTAGAGRSFGSSVEQLGSIISELDPATHSSVGVCIDTCHAHAFGIDLSTPAAWEQVVDEIETACGPGSLGLVHANDCKFERGSRKDRHAWIGDGFLGTEAFEAMLCIERLRDVSAVTEMPGDVPDKDVVNIERLKQLRLSCR